jgi:hypothetical protein
MSPRKRPVLAECLSLDVPTVPFSCLYTSQRRRRDWIMCIAGGKYLVGGGDEMCTVSAYNWVTEASRTPIFCRNTRPVEGI